MIDLTRANCELLKQGAALLSRHDDASYIAGDASSYGSAIGPHFRHVLDHYRSFLGGVESGRIDYDDRKRDTLVEKDRGCAIAELERLGGLLGDLDMDLAAPVDVRVSASVDEEGMHSKSSFGRELQFLVSHTVHHYALIAIASRMLGVPPSESFGVAPSTLKFLKTANR